MISAFLTGISFVFGIRTGICVAVCCVSLGTVNAFFTIRRYRAISELSEELDTVLHGKNESGLEIEKYEEGELSVLKSEIYKMTVRLREQADEMKKEKVYLSDSLADISHQIRTPLTSINLIVDFLADSTLSPERREELTKELYGLLGNIEWLVTTLLKISRLDAGTVKFAQDRVDIGTLISHSYENVAVSMDLHNIEFEVVMNGGESFIGDMRWSCEAITNILKNCTEHTPDGGKITVTVSETPVFTEIRINDTGDGFKAQELPHIFERFYRGQSERDTSSVSKPAGFGIGLALSRMIVISQNGTVRALNSDTGGALFVVKFYKCTV